MWKIVRADSCQCGQVFMRTIVSADNRQGDNWHGGQLSGRTIVREDICPRHYFKTHYVWYCWEGLGV